MSRQADLPLYKDKIEVSLDGRQIFYLFFGGALIVGLVFVLGVMVGRRVEARGHVDRARTTTAADPLAALDRLESNGGLSFKGALMNGNAPAEDVEKTIAALEKSKLDKPADDKPLAKPAKAEKPAKEDKAEKVEKPAVEEKHAEEKTAEAKKPPEKSAEKTEDKPEKKEEPKPKYVLQVSSFQDRTEADAFVETIKAQGFSPFITEATVSGNKYYRVRIGAYSSVDAANEAKTEVEKKLAKSATVMKL